MDIRKLQRNERPPMDLLGRVEPNQKVLQQKFRQAECFVVVDNNKYAGVYLLVEENEECEVQMLVIHPQYEGQGLEKEVLVHAKEMAKDKGHKTVKVATSNANIEHFELLQRCGYRIVAVEKDYYIRTKGQVIIINDLPVLDRLIFQAKI